MLVKTIDGTPDAVKAACPVWSGGKSGDDFKGLPITISCKEIAAAEKISTRAVQKSLRSGLKRLGEILKKFF